MNNINHQMVWYPKLAKHHYQKCMKIPSNMMSNDLLLIANQIWSISVNFWRIGAWRDSVQWTPSKWVPGTSMTDNPSTAPELHGSSHNLRSLVGKHPSIQKGTCEVQRWLTMFGWCSSPMRENDQFTSLLRNNHVPLVPLPTLNLSMSFSKSPLPTNMSGEASEVAFVLIDEMEMKNLPMYNLTAWQNRSAMLRSQQKGGLQFKVFNYKEPLPWMMLSA